MGTSSLGPRAIPLQNRGWLPGESAAARTALPGLPSAVGSPAGRQQPGSSGIAPSAKALQTAQPSPASAPASPALPLSSKSGLPAARGAGSGFPEGVLGMSRKIRLVFARAVWPFKQAHISHFPKENTTKQKRR